MTYQRLIAEIDTTVNPRHVEAHMRLEHGCLDHLPHEAFVREIALFKLCEAEEPGYGEAIARSFGL
jgi:hypothetical protein